MVNAINAMEIFLMNNTNTYKMFGIHLIFNTFKDFHDHYIKKDVLLLADIFENLFLRT